MGRMTKEVSTQQMGMKEVINTLKGLVFGSFGRTTPKEREALDKAIKALEDQEWIPCDKGKPDPYRRVLMTERRPDWNGKEYYIVTLDSFCNHRGDVVAWMFLPEPYKERREG